MDKFEKKSLMPRYDMADLMLGEELQHWSKKLEGKVFKSFEELKRECPEAETITKLRKFEEYGTYYTLGNGKFIKEKLAYKCPKCGDIIGGMPNITKENSMGKMPLAGKVALHYHCKKCKSYLEDRTFVCS